MRGNLVAVFSKIKNKPKESAGLVQKKHLFFVLIIFGVPLGMFFVFKSLMPVSAEDDSNEPYSIFIVAGQSNAEGTQSNLTDLPDGDKLGEHPADDGPDYPQTNEDSADNAQIWWEGSDGVELTGSWEHIFQMFQNPLYNPAGWNNSDSNSDPEVREGLVNMKDIDEPVPVGQRLGYFGPELGIAREAYDKGRRKIIILKVSYGFQALAQTVTTFVPYDWNPDVANNGQADVPNRSDKAYRHLISAYNELTSKLNSENKKYTVDGFFWLQGETDSLDTGYSSLYEQNFDLLVNRVKEDTHLHPKAHFVARKFNMKKCLDNSGDPFNSPVNYCGFAWFTQLQGITPQNFLGMFEASAYEVMPLNANRARTVREAMQNVADKYEWVDIMETDPDSDFANDYVHMVASGQLLNARRMLNMYSLPYKASITDPLSKRNDYDSDGILNPQEDTGRGSGCLYMVDDVEINVANNGNLGDDDTDCDGFPEYLDAIVGAGSGMSSQ